MEVQILDALVGPAGQPRRVPISDVVVVGVEQVQQIDAHLEARATPAERRVYDGRRARADAAVLDERPRAEVACASAAVEAVRALPGDAGRDHAVDGAG